MGEQDTDFDWYEEHVIKPGDEGSKFLEEYFFPTLQNNDYSQIVRGGNTGLPVVRLADDEIAIAHVQDGDPNATSSYEHCASLGERLLEEAERLGGRLVAISDVIDTVDSNLERLEEGVRGLRDVANRKGIAVQKGENAVLTDRVRDFNIMGVGLTVIKRGALEDALRHTEGMTYAVIEHKGNSLFMNADGTGTRPELDTRAGTPENATYGLPPMLAEDGIREGARVQAILGTVESNLPTDYSGFHRIANEIGERVGFPFHLKESMIGDRLQPYAPGVTDYNLNGVAISTIDEERLQNPPRPREGDYLILIEGGIRQNGITDVRRALKKLFEAQARRAGKSEWHEIDVAQRYLKQLNQPSKFFYPLFDELLSTGQASWTGHASGGSFNGKFSNPVAREGLYALLERVHRPQPEVLILMATLGMNVHSAYGKWPMGNEGWIATSDPDNALATIARYGHNGLVGGRLEKATPKTGAGIRLVSFNDGEQLTNRTLEGTSDPTIVDFTVPYTKTA